MNGAIFKPGSISFSRIGSRFPTGSGPGTNAGLSFTYVSDIHSPSKTYLYDKNGNAIVDSSGNAAYVVTGFSWVESYQQYSNVTA
jgi:hypothetical protein